MANTVKTSEAKFCEIHRFQPMQWVHCGNCGGGGYTSHDCGEDSCCCVDPDDNVPCDICGGTGAVVACPACLPDEEYEANFG